MATPAQIHSNRINAKHSTGPKTETGKSASSKNALKHGFYAREIIVRDDEKQEFKIFRDTLLAECLPESTLAHDLFQKYLHTAWNLHRLRTIESELLLSSRNPFADPETRLQLDAVARHSARLDRAYYRALKEYRLQISNEHSRYLLPATIRGAIPLACDVSYFEKSIARRQQNHIRLITSPPDPRQAERRMQETLDSMRVNGKLPARALDALAMEGPALFSGR